MSRKGDQTRERILDAAQSEVLERGFAATSVDRIQEAADISRGTFFYHFATKQDLARALIHRYATSDRSIVDELMARAEHLATDPLQQALLFVAFHEELFEETGMGETGCLFASYAYEAGLFDKETHGVILDSIAYFTHVFGEKLAEAIEVHDVRGGEADPRLLAELGYGVIQGAFILSKSLGDSGIMVRHTREFRRYLELLFGVVGDGASTT